MKNPKEPLKISFSTQKGGVGKSTFTTIISSLLHYRLGYNVLVVDCDFPQYSLSGIRERDLKIIMKNDYQKKIAMKQFQAINKKAYPIIKCRPDEAMQTASEYIKNMVVLPDFVFFDLPGTANTKGVLTTLKAMDYIFAPITADRVVVESALSFAKAFLQLPGGPVNESNFWLFWNQVDGREKTDLYETYEKVIAELDLSIMETRVTDSKRFRKEGDSSHSYIFRSSLLAADSRLMKLTRIDQYILEFLKIIRL